MARLRDDCARIRRQQDENGPKLDSARALSDRAEETLRADARANAIQSVRIQAAIELIASLENMEATKEEIGQAAAMVCRQNGMTMEQLKPYYDAEFEAALVRSVLTGKAMALVRECAEITEK